MGYGIGYAKTYVCNPGMEHVCYMICMISFEYMFWLRCIWVMHIHTANTGPLLEDNLLNLKKMMIVPICFDPVIDTAILSWVIRL